MFQIGQVRFHFRHQHSFGTGGERRFPLHSPAIDSIKVVRKGRVRRAKLYYLRNLRGKAARIVERRDNSEK